MLPSNSNSSVPPLLKNTPRGHNSYLVFMLATIFSRKILDLRFSRPILSLCQEIQDYLDSLENMIKFQNASGLSPHLTGLFFLCLMMPDEEVVSLLMLYCSMRVCGDTWELYWDWHNMFCYIRWLTTRIILSMSLRETWCPRALVDLGEVMRIPSQLPWIEQSPH